MVVNMSYDYSEWKNAFEFIATGNFAQADIIADRVIEVSKNEPADRDVAKFLYELGREYCKTAQFDKALETALRASEIDALIHGIESTVLASDMNLLAMIHDKLNHFSEAEAYLSRTLEIRQKNLSDSHPETIRTLYQIGHFYKNHHRPEKSRLAFLKVYLILKNDAQKDLVLYLDLLKHLTESSVTKGDASEQKKFLEEYLDIYQRVFGREHVGTAAIMETLGQLYFEQGNIELAESYFKQAFAISLQTVGNDHSQTENLQRTIKALDFFKTIHTIFSANPTRTKTFSQPMKPYRTVTFWQFVRDTCHSFVYCCRSVYTFFRHWSRGKTYMTFLILTVLALLSSGLLFWKSNSILAYSVRNDRPLMGKTALFMGANPDFCPDGIKTLLFDAVLNENTELAKMLVNCGANVDFCDRQKRTPLFYAATNRNMEMVDLLLNAGSRIDLQDDRGQTPLFHAIKSHFVESLEKLSGVNADFNQEDNLGYSLLYYAIDTDDLQSVEFLLDRGACFDKENSLPFASRKILHAAVAKGGATILERLLQNGLDSQGTFDDGTTILWPVVDRQQENLVSPMMVSLLIDMGIDVNATDKSGRNVLFRVVTKGNFVPQLLDKLIQAGIDVNHRDRQGKTVAYVFRNVEVGRCLLEAGLDLSIADHTNIPPVLEALQKEDFERLDLFQKIGIDINAKIYEGHSALGWIVAALQKEIEPIESEIRTLRYSGDDKQPSVDMRQLELSDAQCEAVKEYFDFMDTYKVLGMGGRVQGLTSRSLMDESVTSLTSLVERALQSQSGMADLNFWLKLKDLPPLSEEQYFVLNSKRKLADNKLKKEADLLRKKRTVEDKYAVKIKKLAAIGANIDESDDHGRTFLYQSVENYQPSVTDVLLGCGATVDASDNSGWTPLHQAIDNTLLLISIRGTSVAGVTTTSSSSEKIVDDTETVKKLLAVGADVHTRDSAGNTMLHRAASSNIDTVICQLLLEKGSDINAKNDAGRVPLHYAVLLNPNISVVKYLIEKGAYVNAICNRGITPLDIVANTSIGSEEKKAILLEAGGKSGKDLRDTD